MSFKMKFSGGKTPFMFKGEDPTIDPVKGEKPKPKETKFIDTPEGRVAVERVTDIPGSERKTYEEVGVSREEGEQYWKENPEKYEEYLKSTKPTQIVERRDVNMRNTPSSMQPGRNFFGLTISKDVGDQMPMQNISNLYKKARELNKNDKDMLDLIDMDFRRYLRENKYKRGSSSTKIGGWYASN